MAFIHGGVSPHQSVFAASTSGPQHLLDTIDNHLLNLKSNTQSVYYGSLKRWIAEDVKYELPAWVATLGWVLGAVLMMSLAGGVLLKRQVNARTRELRQINQEMEQRIVQRTAELAAAVENAQAADRQGCIRSLWSGISSSRPCRRRDGESRGRGAPPGSLASIPAPSGAA